MTVLVPLSLDEALDALAARPDALVVAGGTDAMVGINEGHLRVASRGGPDHVVCVDRVAELRTWTHDPVAGTVTIGAGVTYTELLAEPFATWLPALAQAARTVGSPQIRNAGTLGGNLATCSPAGDGLPVVSALDGVVHLRSASGDRQLSVHDFMVGVKRTALVPGELITAVTLPVLDGWQGYAKVGVRNAMVIATASACLAVDRRERSVRIALGSVGPTIIRCRAAERLAAGGVDWERGSISGSRLDDVAAAAAAESRPIDDHRSTADYRRRAAGVMVRRLARRAFTELDE